MDLDLYLQRIGYRGPLEPNFDILRKLHRQHLLTIPYENFDIHLGRKIELDERAFFDKLVGQKRGGWCYEMNGLFAWVLREVGFEVRLLAGAVRPVSEAKIEGNHLVLLVELERPYIVDVGFGDGFLEPLPLEEGEYRQDYLNFRLAKEGEWWIVHNHPNGGAKRYDFTLEPYELHQFAAKCHELQTSPASGFVRTTVSQRFTPQNILVLRGATFKAISEAGVTTRFIETEAEYRQVLAEYFGLDLGDISALWPRVWQGHQEWLKQQEAP
jgi:N-hydroxyarylamine O-acetyltransferase